VIDENKLKEVEDFGAYGLGLLHNHQEHAVRLMHLGLWAENGGIEALSSLKWVTGYEVEPNTAMGNRQLCIAAITALPKTEGK